MIMEYVSFGFYIFIVILAVVYYLIPLKYRWWALLAGSLSFYWYLCQGSKRKFILLIILSLLTWLFSILMERNAGHRKVYLAVAVLTDAAMLLFIREFPFVYETVTHKESPSWLIVPVGISFWAMQLISYSVDVYKGIIKAERNFFRFLLFSSFFPQIIQGPIPRYSQLSDQLTEGHRFDEHKFVKGFMLILWGFFLKLCIADKAGIAVDTVFDNNAAYRGMYVLVAGILYSIQLYADFMSCTSLAQGVAGLFGINIIDNFMRPYFAVSIKDFWRRWHISLSSWLKDYIYIPLGGNRNGKVKKYINIFLTFAVSGIWHGAGFKFLFWGMMHGLYQIIGELVLPVRKAVCRVLHIEETGRLFVFIERMITFLLVMTAWIIFRADHLKTGLSMLGSIFTVRNPWILTNDSIFSLGLEWKEFILLIMCMMVLLAVSILQERGIKIREYILKRSLVVRWSIYIGAILFIMLFGTYGYGFEAQAFIYGGF